MKEKRIATGGAAALAMTETKDRIAAAAEPPRNDGRADKQCLSLRYTVRGDPRTKKNSQMIAGSGRRCPVCKKFAKEWIRQGPAYNNYAEQAAWQLRPKPKEPISTPVNVRYLFYMKTRRRVDLVNLIEAMNDILVARGILADDNARIIVSHDGSRVLYDKDLPRVEVEIEEVDNGN